MGPDGLPLGNGRDSRPGCWAAMPGDSLPDAMFGRSCNAPADWDVGIGLCPRHHDRIAGLDFAVRLPEEIAT
jgi:hypothetical protein